MGHMLQRQAFFADAHEGRIYAKAQSSHCNGNGRHADCLPHIWAIAAGGMPDLLLWKPAEQVAKLSEVKGPRDRLSEQQRAWIAALTSAGLHVEVLKVVEPKGPGKAPLRRR